MNSIPYPYDINTTEVSLINKKLREVPEWIQLLPNLEELNLNMNRISIVPAWLGNMTNLKSLYLCKNVKNKLIILDNGKIHKTEETKNIIKNSGNYLLYTCPYHPRLNCIEQWFNQVKHYMKLSKSNNFNELNSNLKKSINNINKDNYKNYFIYAYNKDLYKTLKRKKLSTKHRTLKIYKN